MEQRKIKVREAARAAAIAPSTIVSWRGGASPENFEAVARLAQILGTSLSYLLTGERDKPADPALRFVERRGLIFDGYARVLIEKIEIS
jgi:transcriptional regulator with XRE-family HTH domain